MGKSNFWNVIERTIEKAQEPLTAREIWDRSYELGTIGDFKTTGKTPWATIAAYCYTDINNNGESSRVIQTSTRPAQFFLRRLASGLDLSEVQTAKDRETAEKERKESKSIFKEADLHHLLVAYAKGNSHFLAHLKTIRDRVSKKGLKGKNEWLHPDLVGVYFPFTDYPSETLEMQKELSISSIKLFSFELKKQLGFGNLRESYFQAVSNSSWANEGYLVALSIDDDPTLKDEMRRLNNAFGIGIIQLNAENVFESDILLPSRINPEIDWSTVNRIVSENSDFRDFLKLITEDCKLRKVKSQYDKVLTEEDLAIHINSKQIITKV